MGAHLFSTSSHFHADFSLSVLLLRSGVPLSCESLDTVSAHPERPVSSFAGVWAFLSVGSSRSVPAFGF